MKKKPLRFYNFVEYKITFHDPRFNCFVVRAEMSKYVLLTEQLSKNNWLWFSWNITKGCNVARAIPNVLEAHALPFISFTLWFCSHRAIIRELSLWWKNCDEHRTPNIPTTFIVKLIQIQKHKICLCFGCTRVDGVFIFL